MILTYDLGNVVDGYTVTAVGENSVIGANKIACIAEKVIATGNTSQFRCITKGYVPFLRYDATNAISVGEKLCANAGGEAVQCAACDTAGGTNDCQFGVATSNSGIISLESKASGTGTNLKALINVK